MGSAGSIALFLAPAGWAVIHATPLHARGAYLLLKHGSLSFVSSLEQGLAGCGDEELIPSTFFCPTEACGSRPAFAAVEKVLLAQWPSQEKLLLAEQNRKKHKNTTITSKT